MLVAHDVGAFDGGKDADFVEGVLLLFFGEVVHFDFFESVDLGVHDSLDLVDAGVGALAEFGQYDKVFEGHACFR